MSDKKLALPEIKENKPAVPARRVLNLQLSEVDHLQGRLDENRDLVLAVKDMVKSHHRLYHEVSDFNRKWGHRLNIDIEGMDKLIGGLLLEVENRGLEQDRIRKRLGLDGG